MDDELRSRLWNLLTSFYWEKGGHAEFPLHELGRITENMNIFVMNLWQCYFKQPYDSLGVIWREVYRKIRVLYFGFKWYDVYDFIEFVANYYPEHLLVMVYEAQTLEAFQKFLM